MLHSNIIPLLKGTSPIGYLFKFNHELFIYETNETIQTIANEKEKTNSVNIL